MSAPQSAPCAGSPANTVRLTRSRQSGPEIAHRTSAPYMLRHVSQQGGPIRFREKWGTPGQSLPPTGACECQLLSELSATWEESRTDGSAGESLSFAEFQTSGLFCCTTLGGTTLGLPAGLRSQPRGRGGRRGPSFRFRASLPSPAPTRHCREGLRAGRRQWGRAGGKRLFMLC